MHRNLSIFVKHSILLLITILSLTSCDSISKGVHHADEKTSLIAEETEDTITCRLPDGNMSTVSKHPKRTIILLTSLLNLWVESGGTAIARCTGDLNVPPEARDIPQVGTFSNPNAEKVIALQPDLVISSDTTGFRDIIPILEQNNVPYAYFRYINHYDYLNILDVFSRINGTEKMYHAAYDKMTARIDAIVEGCKQFPAPKVLVIFTSTNSVSCELPSSQTGVMLTLLGAKNIIPEKYHYKTKTRIDFNLEKIVELDPDIILLNTMGEVDACRDRLRKEFETNAAWSTLRAIKQGRFHVLPKKYFLYKPNDEFPEALTYLARLLYPDINFSSPLSADKNTKNSNRKDS
ncbi:MAG: ABC transporter substrate-binding protein [Desulfobacteraceae bacterium]